MQPRQRTSSAALLAIMLAGATATAEPSAGSETNAVHADEQVLSGLAQQLSDALDGGDAAALAAMLQAPLEYRDLWLDDPACKKEFDTTGVVTRKQLGRFAGCVLKSPALVGAYLDAEFDGAEAKEAPTDGVDRLHVWFSRKGRRRIVALVFDPGGVENGVDDGVVGNGAAPPPPSPPPPPVIVAPQALTRVTGSSEVRPSAEASDEIAHLGKDRVIASVKVCIDPTGAVVATKLIKSSGVPSYDREILHAIEGWKFQPWRERDKPVMACAAFTIIHRRR